MIRKIKNKPKVEKDKLLRNSGLGILVSVISSISVVLLTGLYKWVDQLPLHGWQLVINLGLVLVVVVLAITGFSVSRIYNKIACAFLFVIALGCISYYNFNYAFSHILQIKHPSVVIVLPKLDDKRKASLIEAKINLLPFKISSGGMLINIVKHYQQGNEPFINTLLGRQAKYNPFVISVIQIFSTDGGYEIQRYSPHVSKILDMGFDHTVLSYKNDFGVLDEYVGVFVSRYFAVKNISFSISVNEKKSLASHSLIGGALQFQFAARNSLSGTIKDRGALVKKYNSNHKANDEQDMGDKLSSLIYLSTYQYLEDQGFNIDHTSTSNVSCNVLLEGYEYVKAGDIIFYDKQYQASQIFFCYLIKERYESAFSFYVKEGKDYKTGLDRALSNYLRIVGKETLVEFSKSVAELSGNENESEYRNMIIYVDTVYHCGTFRNALILSKDELHKTINCYLDVLLKTPDFDKDFYITSNIFLSAFFRSVFSDKKLPKEIVRKLKKLDIFDFGASDDKFPLCKDELVKAFSQLSDIKYKKGFVTKAISPFREILLSKSCHFSDPVINEIIKEIVDVTYNLEEQELEAILIDIHDGLGINESQKRYLYNKIIKPTRLAPDMSFYEFNELIQIIKDKDYNGIKLFALKKINILAGQIPDTNFIKLVINKAEKFDVLKEPESQAYIFHELLQELENKKLHDPLIDFIVRSGLGTNKKTCPNLSHKHVFNEFLYLVDIYCLSKLGEWEKVKEIVKKAMQLFGDKKVYQHYSGFSEWKLKNNKKAAFIFNDMAMQEKSPIVADYYNWMITQTSPINNPCLKFNDIIYSREIVEFLYRNRNKTGQDKNTSIFGGLLYSSANRNKAESEISDKLLNELISKHQDINYYYKVLNGNVGYLYNGISYIGAISWSFTKFAAQKDHDSGEKEYTSWFIKEIKEISSKNNIVINPTCFAENDLLLINEIFGSRFEHFH